MVNDGVFFDLYCGICFDKVVVLFNSRICVWELSVTNFCLCRCCFFLSFFSLLNIQRRLVGNDTIWEAGRPTQTYIQQLCEDTSCSPEDLPEAINNTEKWQERVRDIHAGGMTWWWWWYIYIYACIKQRSLVWFSLVLWHINHCWLFNVKSIFIHKNSSISNNSV